MERLEHMAEAWLREHTREMIDELGLWVACPSVSRADLGREGAPYGPDCRRMLDLALERGRHYGFETADYGGYCGAVVSPGKNGEEIGLVSHLDVVPEGDHWIFKPYEMTEKEGFLIGRGVGDNKGSGVMALFLLRFFRECGVPLAHGLRLMLGCAEETGMDDYTQYVNKKMGPLPKVTLVPDAGFPVCYAQKGGFNATFRIPAGRDIVDFTGGPVRNAIPDRAELTVRGVGLEAARAVLAGCGRVEVLPDGENVRIVGHGKAGHAAGPEEGVQNSAIIIAAQAAAVLEEAAGLDLTGVRFLADAFPTAFGEGLGIQYADEPSGKLTINAGIMHKEGDTLCLDIDIRFPVTQSAADIEARLREELARVGGELTAVDIANPCYTDVADPRVAALMSAYRDVTGDTQSRPYSMGGGTYSRVIPNAITFGPGLPSRPDQKGADFLPAGHGGGHGPDEALSIEKWLDGFKIYVHAIVRLDKALCGE